MLFTPDRHEALDERLWSEATARAAIARIADRAERELDRTSGRWPLDPADVDGDDTRPLGGLYMGAAGIIWALTELAAEGLLASRPGDSDLVDRLETGLLAEPEDIDDGGNSVWFGAPGAFAVGERLSPDAARRDRLAEMIAASLDSPALEPLFGHPGHMVLAAQLHARTGEARWADLWSAGAERLLETWHHDEALGAWLWTQRLAGHDARYVGPAHGLVGNVHTLLRGEALLAPKRRVEVEQRAVESLMRLAVVENGRANWPPGAEGPLEQNGRIRVQWCHGAPGVLTGLADVARDDVAWSALMVAAGQLVWEAGPIRDDSGLCHGTAGNAYALLALWRRTGDEQWLERARAFAQHAAGQVEARVERLGHGRHSLFTGDEGVALCLASCVAGDARLPIADRLL